MGWHNPPMSWAEFERKASGRARDEPIPTPVAPTVPDADGEASPSYVFPYAELHAHSNFSFLDGASSPQELIAEAARLRLSGIALTDHDGFYGAAQFAEAAEAHPQLLTIFGAELSLGLSAPQNGVADPEGDHLLLLARGTRGYHRLSAAITAGQLAQGAQKGRPRYELEELAQRGQGDWLVLSGCRKGAVRRALTQKYDGDAAAERELHLLADYFGRENVVVELIDQGNPADSVLNDRLARIAKSSGFAVVATNNVHYAQPSRHRVAAALAAVRASRPLSELDGWLPAGPTAFLRSGAEMQEQFSRFPGAVERTVDIAQELAFPLKLAKPRLPRLPLPAGHTQMSYLRELVWRGAQTYYPKISVAHRERIENELNVIEYKDFPGYFLIVHEIVQFARSQGILCQGRGSAANSAVCYLLEITAVDAIKYGLPFERFLNSVRDEEPDIDVDFDARRREEVIQHVYDTYGRLNAAQVCNVISYRPKFALRNMAGALGYSAGQQDAWSKRIEGFHGVAPEVQDEIPEEVRGLAEQISKFPRHLGIHSGGMVLTDQPVSEIVPIENARMDKRTVLQWDKDDCAYMGLVKFDLLGLGMLCAIQKVFDMTRDFCQEEWTLASIPKEEKAVYDQLCLADSIGVFQVESRAQIGMLPRLKPREFYDLVVEIALVRPGPIQGGAVHPYMRRRSGIEAESYAHPKLIPVLKRTKGVPIFQEQLMGMAMAVGNCGPEEADLLRRAMGSKRGQEKIESLRAKLYAGMAANNITGVEAEGIYQQIASFADFGFAESHSISFALIVYASAWLRLHYPAAFLVALLNSQPMGFYGSRTLVEDAARHGVTVRGPDILRSGAEVCLEKMDPAPAESVGLDSCVDAEQEAPGLFDPQEDHRLAAHRRDAAFAVRLGLSSIKAVGEKLAERIESERATDGPFADLSDLVRRVEPNTAQLEALAEAGALESLVPGRRQALWRAGAAASERMDQLPGVQIEMQAPMLPAFSEWDRLIADVQTTGISPGDHPLKHLRKSLAKGGILSAQELQTAPVGRRTLIAGIVTHRQRPGTARGITFVNIEDETGLVNVVCSQGAWVRFRRIVRESPALIVRGILERSADGVINILADGFEPLALPMAVKSRDFQ